MANNNIFKKIPVEIPNKSGFDLSHENLFTGGVGTLIPVLCDEILPNDTVSLGISSTVQLPPFATDFFGRIEMRYEAFFVPNRILYGGWQDFLTSTETSTVAVISDELPYVSIDNTAAATYLKRGTLADYLGLKCKPNRIISGQPFVLKNILPFLAYQKVYDEWYRDSRIQKPLFSRLDVDYSNPTCSGLPYQSVDETNDLVDIDLADGSNIFTLRQRNYSRDYFTNCTASPQFGNQSKLSFTVSSGTGSFSIAALRAANSLQQWLERNNIAGDRYADQINAQFGVMPSDATISRPIYLGSTRYTVYNKSVYQSAPSEEGTTANPFGTIGAQYSNAVGVGDGSLFDKFTATEHGFIMVLCSLVPVSYYSSGNRRMFYRSKVGDFAFPILAGVGDQEVYKAEICDDPLNLTTFGYTQRYSEYKFMNDEVHGFLRSGESLAPFALSRNFSTAPSLGSSFIEIKTTALDNVAAVTSSISQFGYWCDTNFQYKKISTLPAYSIPTLGDMKNTHTEVIDNGGSRL